MSTDLRLAILGCGAIARYHLDAIKGHVPRVRVTACIDNDADRAAEFATETGGEAFATLEAALDADAFDAIAILLPHDLHEATTLQCLAAGKHVMLEKPMAPTLEGCDRILAAARASGKVFMLAENAQYWPEVVSALDLVRQGAIGDLVTGRAAFVSEYNPYWFTGQKWRLSRSRTGGGITIDGGSHWVRPMRMWFGDVAKAVGVIGYPMEEMQGDSLMRSLLQFESGLYASYDGLMVATPLGPQESWRITGTDGEIVIGGFPSGGLTLYDRAHRSGRAIDGDWGYAMSFVGENRDFANAILDGTPLSAGPESAVQDLRVALAIYRSAASGNWETI